MTTINYTPPPSLVPFFTSDKFINLVIGPVGSTKTTAGIIKIAYEAKRVKACHDGIRRSRAIWIRNTREQLRDTSIPDFLRWFQDGVAGTYAKTEYKFTLRFDDVECEVLFRGLDDSNDVRRLLSLQASFAILDEFREINPDIYDALQGRLGRYPSKADNGVGCCDDSGRNIDKLWGMSNPPDFDTFWEKLLSNPPDNGAVFIQPGGLTPEADWLQFLKDDYYANLAEGKSQDWIDVYINSKFGKSLAGKPVFRMFNRDIHVAKETVNHVRMESSPLMIGLDFGLTPSAVIGQTDSRGRLLVLAELTAESMGIQRFCRERLKPLLNSRFPGMPLQICGDPAGRERAQTDEKSVYDVLRSEGFYATPASTNSIVARINAVDSFLTRMVEGKAGVMIDPSCKELISALRGGYRFKIKTNGESEDKPEKNKYSHVADAMQYLCLYAAGNFSGGLMQRMGKREVIQRPYFYA